MRNTCEHIQSCKKCSKEICNYCVEVCDGCPLEGCEQCYTSHLVQCKECTILLCPELATKVGESFICPACKIQKEMKKDETR